VMKLVDEADAAIAQGPALAFRERVNIAPVDLDLAGVRSIEAAENLQQRGLARARGADDREPLAALDLELHTREDLERRRAFTETAPYGAGRKHRGILLSHATAPPQAACRPRARQDTVSPPHTARRRPRKFAAHHPIAHRPANRS